jgi:Protein of unknown function (DUF3306)
VSGKVHDSERGFLSRWSQRKALVREGAPVAPEAPSTPAPVALPVAAPAAAQPTAPQPVAEPPAPAAPPALTLEDVAGLARDSDYAPFVARNVDPTVKNAALKKLFTDPQFNVMDGLDTYIDDYGKPDPLPAGMLRQMVQSKLLGLFDDEENDKDQPAPGLPPHDEDADLQLQPDDPAGRDEPAPLEPGAGEDAAARGPGEH